MTRKDSMRIRSFFLVCLICTTHVGVFVLLAYILRDSGYEDNVYSQVGLAASALLVIVSMTKLAVRVLRRQWRLEQTERVPS